MNGITYKEIIEYQNRIVEFKDRIEAIITFVDDDGFRKIKPEHFLSGEVAAYKFLTFWKKRMTKGETVIDADVIRILGDIKNLLYWITEEDFSKQDTIDSYEVINTSLWIDLLSSKDIAPSIEFNNLIVNLASISLAAKGISDEDNDYLNYTYNDLLDGLAVGEAYSVAHDWLLSLPRDKLIELMNNTEMYRFHFNILN